MMWELELASDADARRTRMDNATRIFTAVRNQILSLEREPSSVLDEVGLAKHFGTSRSPVREALVRLEAEQLVTTLPNRATIVTPLNVAQVPQYIDALDLIQRAAMRLAAVSRTAQDIKDLCKLNDVFADTAKSANLTLAIEANVNFHDKIGQATQNVYIEKTYRQLLEAGSRFQILYYRTFENNVPTEAVQAHADRIHALERGDLDESERLGAEHTSALQQRLVEFIAQRHTNRIALK